MSAGRTSQDPLDPAVRRKARRIAEITPAALRALHRGQLETVTLVEWLAIDQRVLLRHVLAELDCDAPTLRNAAAALAGSGVTQRSRGLGAALAALSADQPELLPRFAQHRCDMVRAWAAYAIGALPGLQFRERLARLRPFAADRSMATRECAWDAWRPQFRLDVGDGLRALRPWVRDADPNVRRCAVEGSRPRGVWTAHIAELKQTPELAEPLLEPLRADPSRYVQTAVANWLNDASKTRAPWVRALTSRWLRESPGAATAWIVRRALRTLRRSGATGVPASAATPRRARTRRSSAS